MSDTEKFSMAVGFVLGMIATIILCHTPIGPCYMLSQLRKQAVEKGFAEPAKDSQAWRWK